MIFGHKLETEKNEWAVEQISLNHDEIKSEFWFKEGKDLITINEITFKILRFPSNGTMNLMDIPRDLGESRLPEVFN